MTRRLLLAVSVLVLSGTLGAVARGDENESADRPAQQAAITGGGSHSCALGADGAVRCWGGDLFGQLGDGAPDANTSAPAAAVALGQSARAISAGGAHSCALLAGGTVRCWGQDVSGQLGDGPPNAGTSAPTAAVALGQSALAISAGGAHSCALLADGTVRCWGHDVSGQLGDGPPNAGTSAPAAAVALGQGALAISAGANHTCALLADGTVRCWGSDAIGELGDGAPNANTPAPAAAVALGQSARAITTGGNHSCALLAAGTVRCWGFDGNGELGDGVPNADTSAPAAAVALGQSARAITTGDNHGCALLADGATRCWGSDGSGQLGDGAPNASSPGPAAAVALGPSARAITTGSFHSCALLTDATLRCWGVDGSGQLGDGTPNANTPAPSDAVGLPPFASVDSADVSLSLSASAGSANVGEQRTLTLIATNAGPEPAAVEIAVPLPAGLSPVSALPSQGAYSASTAIWRPTIPAGSTATLTQTIAAQDAGAHTTVAEVIDSSATDPDSTPANDAPGEDDRAQTTVTVATPPAPTPTPTPTPRVVKVRPDSLRVTLRPSRDRTAPFRYTATATMVVTRAALLSACRGTITFRARAGTRTVLTQRAPLRLSRGVCSARSTLTIRTRARARNAARLGISAAFAGNAALLARTSAECDSAADLTSRESSRRPPRALRIAM